MKSRIALLLAILLTFSAVSLSACSTPAENMAEDTTTAAADTTAGETTPAEPDPYEGYDYEGKALRIYSSADASDSTNANFLIAGSGDINGEVVNDTVHARNAKIEEKLGVELEYTICEWNYLEITAGVDQLIMAGDNPYDIIINDMFCLVQGAIKGQFRNIAKTDILNLEADYWYRDAMEDLVIVPGAMYLMLSDYFADSLASAHVLYYNKDAIEDNYGDANYLYNIIMEGGFTKDVMIEIMETCAQDLNGDGVWEQTDRMGYIVPGYWGPMMPVVTGFDVNYIGRDDEGGVYFDFANEHSVEVLTACNELFHHELSLRSVSGETIQGTIHTLLDNGQAVFAGYLRLSDFGSMRNYQTNIGLAPYPKLNADQEDYVSSLHDTTEVGAILSTVNDEDLDFIYTCLEFLTMESAATVIPAWYEQALKVKYSSGSEDAAILDLIRASIDNPFALAYQSALDGYPLPTCFLNLINMNSNNFMSVYNKSKKVGEAALAKVVESYRNNMENGN